MMVQVVGEAELLREASQVLLEHLSPAKAARFWASWYTGQGDYLAWRDDEFAQETVDSLYEKIVSFQEVHLSEPAVPVASPDTSPT